MVGREPTSTVSSTRPGSSVERYGQADTLLLRVLGVIDESFPGFGDVGEPKTVVMDVSAITRITSFGVRQWIVALERLPKSIGELYFLGCPTCFVDQLNMVLNFGGRAKVVTAYAPYECPNCGRESDELVDVLTGRRDLVRDPPFRECSGCSGMMELDETPESYFAFVATSGASSIDLGAAQLLASYGLYVSDAAATERPPRITKLVHGTVTYYRVNGTIGAMFRARPFLVGSEGEVVIDLADVDRCAPSGEPEWRRLLKTLAHQVSATTLVDIPPSLLQIAPQSVTIARNIAVASLLAPYSCTECGRASQVSVVLHDDEWPPRFTAQVCGACGGTTKPQLAPELLQPLHKASKALSPAAAKVVELRRELLSRALIDANVARAAMTNTGLEGQVVLGKYEIVRALSSGGMAEVFLAKQVGLDKPVAIKRIQSELMEHRRRAIELFLNEAKIAGRLTHPGIAQVLDVGEAGGAVYIAMEYVHGRDLRHVLKEAAARECALPIELACYIAREVAEALDYAYWSSDLAGKQLAVVHRDVSTHNVIVGFDGTVKLIDFGVAMSAITEHEEGLVVGKFQYMAPEAATTRQVGHRSDLFSLGVVLYMMCTGWAPFADRNPEVLARKKRNGEYPHLDEVMPEVPLELSTLVERMLAPDPVHRPERGREVASELNEIMRAYGGGSAAALAEYLRTMFPDAPPDPDAIELVRAGSASDSAKSDSASLSGSQSHPINPTETPTPSAAPTATATPTVTATPTPSVPTTVAPRPSPLATPAGGVSRRHQAPHTSFRDLAIAVGIGLAIVGTLLLAVYLMFIKD